ncbi:hypothetical protein K501DRAFT_168612 [Backusella circina FSU 941]|nr:hypothetical protein K501DRAFT_168612 [Backusella circina FSU 941]
MYRKRRNGFNKKKRLLYSTASEIPSSMIENVHSDSGKHGESYILQIRFSPLPLRRYNRVHEAWAMIFPPAGFFGSGLNMEAPPSTCATT